MRLWVVEALDLGAWKPCGRYTMACGCFHADVYFTREPARVAKRDLERTRRAGKYRVKPWVREGR